MVLAQIRGIGSLRNATTSVAAPYNFIGPTTITGVAVLVGTSSDINFGITYTSPSPSNQQTSFGPFYWNLLNIDLACMRSPVPPVADVITSASDLDDNVVCYFVIE